MEGVDGRPARFVVALSQTLPPSKFRYLKKVRSYVSKAAWCRGRATSFWDLERDHDLPTMFPYILQNQKMH
jgi:hypothetical protein